jgi:hypothetical protein
MSQIAGTVAAMRIVITMRPPYLSVQMPSGTRTSDPVSTGVAVSRPNSVAFRPSVFLSGMPMTPNIIHTMKHTVKAKVLTTSTDQACRGIGALVLSALAVSAIAGLLLLLAYEASLIGRMPHRLDAHQSR